LIFKFFYATLSAMLRRCFFILIMLLMIATPVYAGTVINEIAWMGTEESASNEWIELYSDTEQNLSGWILTAEDGGMNLRLKGTTTAGGYFLIERTDDNSVPDIKADLVSVFGKGLSNDGEILILKNAEGIEVHRVDGSGGWVIGGDNDSKNTLQRNLAASSGWITAKATPKAKNAEYVRPKPKAAPTASLSTVESGAVSLPGKKSDFLGKSDSEDGGAGGNFEYFWLLGGILGGAVLGLLCVIIAKWKKNP